MIPAIPCELVASHAEFRRLDDIARIQVDLRYASPNNFVGRDVYSPLDCAWLHCDAARGLEKSVAWLASQQPDLQLMVLDAMRPQRVQEQLWDALRDTDLQMYLANPVRGSIHSFGMAVDITVIDKQGNELDMGTSFDDLTELSHPAKENEFLASGALNRKQLDNRRLLREAMRHGGFAGINTEWWHFDCGDRLVVRTQFARIL
ncbi:MAG: M15 family metallopeptidase [Betaproteobacteria bacterium]